MPRTDLNLELPKYQTKAIKPFSRDEIARLLKAYNLAAGKHSYKWLTAKRDQAVIMVLLDTGLRRGELLHLLLSDLSIEENSNFYVMQIRPYSSGRKKIQTSMLCKSVLTVLVEKQPLELHI